MNKSARTLTTKVTEGRISQRKRRSSATPLITGHWRKVSDNAAFREYPAQIAFAEDTYLTTKSPGQMMLWWDAGIYRVHDNRTVVISTATDEMVEYAMRLEDNHLTIDIPGVGTVTYERMEEPSQQ